MSETDRSRSGPSVSAVSDSYERIEQVLRDERLFVSTTVGISMWPMLRNRRDTIIVRPVPHGERLMVGDVALYRVDGVDANHKYVLHRVVGVHDGWYAIRGDNRLFTEHVRDVQILGRLEGFYRGSRHVDCASSRGYHFYWRAWMALWPLRYCWKRARALMGCFLRLFGWEGLHPNRGPF